VYFTCLNFAAEWLLHKPPSLTFRNSASPSYMRVLYNTLSEKHYFLKSIPLDLIKKKKSVCSLLVKNRILNITYTNI